jgi:hypothetical protein
MQQDLIRPSIFKRLGIKGWKNIITRKAVTKITIGIFKEEKVEEGI